MIPAKLIIEVTETDHGFLAQVPGAVRRGFAPTIPGALRELGRSFVDLKEALGRLEEGVGYHRVMEVLVAGRDPKGRVIL